MQIHGANNVSGTQRAHGPQKLGGPHFRQAATKPAGGAQGPDRLEISPAAEEAARLAEAAEARAAQRASAAPEVRTELVNRLRAEIASGSYETADKLDGALDRLLDEIG